MLLVVIFLWIDGDLVFGDLISFLIGLLGCKYFGLELYFLVGLLIVGWLFSLILVVVVGVLLWCICFGEEELDELLFDVGVVMVVVVLLLFL